MPGLGQNKPRQPNFQKGNMCLAPLAVREKKFLCSSSLKPLQPNRVPSERRTHCARDVLCICRVSETSRGRHSGSTESKRCSSTPKGTLTVWLQDVQKLQVSLVERRWILSAGFSLVCVHLLPLCAHLFSTKRTHSRSVSTTPNSWQLNPLGDF